MLRQIRLEETTQATSIVGMFNTIRQYLQRRDYRQATQQLLKQARYYLNCRIDLLEPRYVDALRRIENQCLALLTHPDAKPGLEATAEELQGIITKTSPSRLSPKVSENLEIVVVALSIALGFRTYFYQPFKIPTGSMEDTLMGIHVEEVAPNSLLGRLGNLKLATWIFDGVYVKEIRAQASGIVGDRTTWKEDKGSSTVSVPIGNRMYKFPMQAHVRIDAGQYVQKGDLLWRGTIKAGDHVFVDRIRWNFCPPSRGQVVVFQTDHINGLDQGIHYIKRLIGLPGETVALSPPNVIIDGVTNGANVRLGHVAQHPGYQARAAGPQIKTPIDPVKNALGQDVYQVATNGYFCMGDNTGSSFDSRYWGSVPRDNMVGPAVVVYWPFSRRWGFIHWPSDSR